MQTKFNWIRTRVESNQAGVPLAACPPVLSFLAVRTGGQAASCTQIDRHLLRQTVERASMRVLVATAELPFSSWVASAAQRAGCESETAMSPPALVAKLAAGIYDLVILDLTLAKLDAAAAVSAARAHGGQTSVIAVAPHVREDLLAAGVCGGLRRRCRARQVPRSA